MSDPQAIIDACEAEWEAHKSDCSGFAKAVAGRFGVSLTGLANDIVDAIKTSPWSLLQDGVAAVASAESGALVLAGMKGSDQSVPNPHGHLVVVVRGGLAHGLYPTAYWGQLGGVGRKNTTLNWAWRAEDRDRLVYAAIDI